MVDGAVRHAQQRPFARACITTETPLNPIPSLPLIPGGAQRKAAADQAQPAARGGYLQGLIDVIVGNLQLSIKDIHVRYEVRSRRLRL